jgi:Carboxypeptidase regulatory-like domain/TonB dependent receptor-like, beta-barrel
MADLFPQNWQRLLSGGVMSQFSNKCRSRFNRLLLDVIIELVHSGKKAILPIVATIVLFVPMAYAQQQTAQLTGQITDSSGAVIAGATVTVTNPARGIKAVATSDATGGYVVPLLPPAEGYQLTVSKAGFTETTRNGITLQVAQVAKVDIALTVGSVSQNVIVTGAPPLLDTQTSSVGQVIEAHSISSLPLNGRSSFRLIQLTPGVTFNQAAYGQFGDVAVNTTWDADFSINGGRAQGNEILIDGVPSTAGFFNQITTIPSVDDTQEFKVESDNLSAEYGRFGGGVINVTTKSGTNELHGTVFEFLRNNVLNADDYLSKSKGRSVPPFKMNQFGGVIGGPVVIPWIYRGQNKTFFEGDYQGTRRVQGSSFITSVPTTLQRAGDFSQTFNASGNLVTIYNPFSTVVNPANPSQYIRTAFSGNVIPAGLLDPVAKALMAYYPTPNTTGSPYTNANNYISTKPLTVKQNAGSARIDQNVNDRYHFFGRFGWSLTDLTQPNTYGNVASPGNGAVGTTSFHNWSFAFDNTITLNPTLLLSINYGYARWFQIRQTLSYGFDNASLGFPTSFVSAVTIPMFPAINVTSYGAMSGQSYLHNGNDSHSLLTSLTKIAGRHTLIVGADLRLHLINYFNVQASAGTFNFTQAQTQGPNPNSASSTAGNALASLLLGAGNAGSMPIGAGNALKDWYTAIYAQDNFRITPRLTLNAGLRFEEESPYTDRHNRLNYFSTSVSSPAINTQFPNLTGGLVFAAANGAPSSVYDWNKNQFGPRVGFAYTPVKNTVIRGGFGIVYAPLEISNNAVGFAPSTGYSSSTGWSTSLNGGLTPNNLLSKPYPQGLVQPSGNSLGAGTALGQSLSVWDAHPKTPESYQWNLGIQRQLPSDILAEVAYIANRGLHLTSNFQMNTLNPKYLTMGTALQSQVPNPFKPFVSIGALSNATVTQQQLLLPYPQFTGVLEENATWGGSNYQSMQLKVNKRTTHGITMLAVYTVSKWLSDVPASDAPIGTNNGTSVQNPYNLAAEKSLSENDIPQSLIVSGVGELPLGRGQRFLSNVNGVVNKLVGGWSASGILTEQKGFPLALSAPVTDGGNRPNYASGVSPQLSSSRPIAAKVAQWFNTAAFTLPPAFTFGNVSRTIGSVRSPALKNLDLTIDKETQIAERLHMQFRAEAFNLTNTPHFGLPDSSMSSATFGQLTSLLPSPPPREIQFAVKFTF